MVKIGIVGLGGMATVHYSNYKYIEECEVAAVVGSTAKDSEKAREWKVPEYHSISEMLSEQEIDVVDICTPTFLHDTFIKEALLYHKNVIVEKPMVLLSGQAEELFRMAESVRKHIYVGQVTRFAKDNEILQRLVRLKPYGKVKDVYFARLSKVPAWSAGNWMLDKEKSGQLVFDLHIHDLDTIIHLFGKPDSYYYETVSNAEKDYQECYRLYYKYRDFGVCAETAWYHADFPFSAVWRIYFENAVVVSDGASVTAYPFEEEPVHFDISEKKIPTGINVPPTEMYLSELQHFIECASKDIDSDRVPKEQIIGVLDILDEIVFPGR